MADLTAAERACHKGVTPATNKKRNTSWRRWLSFLESIGFSSDPFLDNIVQPTNKQRILSAYAHAIRSGRFSSQSYKELAAGTVEAAVSDVASTFRLHHRGDPRLNAQGSISFILQRQFRFYKRNDGPETQQKAATISMIRCLATYSATSIDIAIGQLIIGAFFFAMRSCEYLHVPASETRKTKILRLKDIRFYRNRRLVPHSSTSLHASDIVAITFVSQKNEERNDIVNQYRTNDEILCPVKAWAAVVTRIRSYKHTNDSTTVNTYLSDGKLLHLTSANVRLSLRRATIALGHDRLGFGPDSVGTHSLRSGAAMAMYLARIPVYTIMLIGRWSSDAFLKYIRKQVQDFSTGVSGRMLTNEETFMTPDATHNDPRIRNHPLNSALRSNAGGNAPFRNLIPQFSLFE